MPPHQCVRVHYDGDFIWPLCIAELLQIMLMLYPTVPTIRVPEKKIQYSGIPRGREQGKLHTVL